MKAEPLDIKFVKPSSISDYLKCPICMQVFRNAERLYCGHTFCQQCIGDCMKTKNTCPECRTVIDRKNIGIDLLAREIINQFEVFCPSEDCPWRGVLQEMNNHINKQCIFMLGQNSNLTKQIKKNDKIVWHESLDEQVLDKINEHTVKGSLQARILVKTDSTKQSLISNNYLKSTASSLMSSTQPRCKKAEKGKKRAAVGRLQKKQEQEKEKEVNIKKSRTSNFDFLSSLFQ